MLATMFNSSFNSQLKPHAGDIVMLEIRTEHQAHSALASTRDAQARWHAIPDPRHTARTIPTHTAAQAAVARSLIGSLGDVELEPLED